ncbi:MAG TPA: hypothetical protein VLY46_01950 [Usitatibacter sp.]|nr:hypothetical protein [Usitatibacter sp.]
MSQPDGRAARFTALVVMPWIGAMEYAAYLDVFGNDPERAMTAMTGTSARSAG